MKPKYIAYCALLLAAAVPFSSCSKIAGLNSIKFPSTPVISSIDSVVLVIDPYVSIRDQPGEAGITVAHARRGEILGVTGKKILKSAKGEEIWIHFDKGWVSEASVRLYSGHEKAEQAAALLK